MKTLSELSELEHEILSELREGQDMRISQMQRLAYNTAKVKGFHDPGINDTLASQVANLHDEVSELWEAARRDALHEECDKSEKMRELGIVAMSCMEEELADIIIRVGDIADHAGVDLELAVRRKMLFNIHRPFRHGGKKA